MHPIDQQSNSRSDQNGQSHDNGLCQHNPSQTDQIVRRGQEALQRLRRSYEDWIDIAEALQVGRAEVMAAVHTNQPTGKRYEKAMAEWLLAHSFHVIDKGARKRLLDCLQHRAAIEKWRGTLTEGERFRYNHPDAVLRKWKAATVVPDANALLKTSAIGKLKEANIELQEKLHRAEQEIARGGGDLWTREDRAEDIADVMLLKLSPAKAELVAPTILKKLKAKSAVESKDGAVSNDPRNDSQKR